MPDQSPQEINPSNSQKELSRMADRDLVEKLPINDIDRVDLVLTLLNFKVGTAIKTASERGQFASGLLRQLGLSFVTRREEEVLYIAKSQDNAQRVYDAFEITNNIREQGKVSGYPDSAIENYARTMEQISAPGKTEEEILNILRENNGDFKLTPEIRKKDFMAFLNFQLSANSWRDELETVSRWAEAIERFNPSLYKRMVEWYHNAPKKV